eukprot:7483682-Pyramimonas_sp.AAC.1
MSASLRPEVRAAPRQKAFLLPRCAQGFFLPSDTSFGSSCAHAGSWNPPVFGPAPSTSGKEGGEERG